jgi:multisubunit Na+/H+ antiporter MnhB subunit
VTNKPNGCFTIVGGCFILSCVVALVGGLIVIAMSDNPGLQRATVNALLVVVILFLLALATRKR